MIIMDPSSKRTIGGLAQQQQEGAQGTPSPSIAEIQTPGAGIASAAKGAATGINDNINADATRPTKKPRMDHPLRAADTKISAAPLSAPFPASYNFSAPFLSGMRTDIPLAYANNTSDPRTIMIAALSSAQQTTTTTRRGIDLHANTPPQDPGLGMISASSLAAAANNKQNVTQDTSDLERAILLEELRLQEMYRNLILAKQQTAEGLATPSLQNTTSTGHMATSEVQHYNSTGKTSPTVQLSLPCSLLLPQDKNTLSTYQCLLRKHIEAFEATEDDVKSHSRGRSKAISVGQVGIRCKHCKGKVAKGSAYFPSTLLGLYQSAQNMALYHINAQDGTVCKDMPMKDREEFSTMMSCKSSCGGGKDFWASAARSIGLVDTPHGIRFQG